MAIRMVLWDLDGVAYEGRATTHLSDSSKIDVKYFKERFYQECGQPGALQDIDGKRFLRCLADWETDKGTNIDTVKKLGSALTDLRHFYGLFTDKHTKYTKNAILEGISMADVNQIMDAVQLNPGFSETAWGFSGSGIGQAALSNASYPVAVYFANRFGMRHGEGVPVKVIDRRSDQEMWYSPEMHGDPNVVFAGEIDSTWDKVEPAKNFLSRNGILVPETAAIDDDNVPMLEAIHAGGGLAVGYKPKDKYRDRMRSKEIPILKGDDIRGFAVVVRDRTKVKDLRE